MWIRRYLLFLPRANTEGGQTQGDTERGWGQLDLSLSLGHRRVRRKGEGGEREGEKGREGEKEGEGEKER